MASPKEVVWNNTKLIATLGPASTSREVLTSLFDAGLDVCRLNFSHGDLDGHRRVLETIRTLANERGEPIAVVGDLCGPKIRLGGVRGGSLVVEQGQVVRFVRGETECTAEQFTTNYAGMIDEVEAGQRVYVDDGMIRLLVMERTKDELVCTCTAGGVVSPHKGVNLPDTTLSTAALTEKDRRDLAWALEHELDYVALSFVRRPADLYELKELIRQRASDTGVVIKIEKPEALEHLDELIVNTDVVLVARGDLGVEMDVWQVPLIQKDITARCRAAGKPVIIATQMLQSMISSPMPTRAEVSDVANAIFDRADAVMLSGETAVGKFPVQAVEMMNRVAQVTEAHLRRHQPPRALTKTVSAGAYRGTAAIAHAAVRAALDLDACLVAVWSATGASVRLVAQHRLPMPVVGLSYDERVCRRMNLLYGVQPIRVEPVRNPAAMAAVLDARLLECGLARRGDLIVVVTSTRPRTPGSTDTTLLHRVGEAHPSPNPSTA
ncbi:MAG: pyruvate kinase [Planctomycetes bacterium]|nr:pyruvate kinase [Planctomycetota bacterium]